MECCKFVIFFFSILRLEKLESFQKYCTLIFIYDHRYHFLASFPDFILYIFLDHVENFAYTPHFSYCKRQNLGWRPGNEAGVEAWE